MARNSVSKEVVSHLRDTLCTEVLSLVASEEDAGLGYSVQNLLAQYQKARLKLLQYVEARKVEK